MSRRTRVCSNGPGLGGAVAASLSFVLDDSVDTAKGTIRTEVRSNYDNSRPVGSRDVTKVYPFTSTFSGFRWVR